VDALGNPTGFHLTPGQTHDLAGADVWLPNSPADAVLADKADDAQERLIEPLENAGKQIVIPSRRTHLIQRPLDRHLYLARHLIENFFAKLKQFRAIATRYDKTTRNSEFTDLCGCSRRSGGMMGWATLGGDGGKQRNSGYAT